MGKKGNDKAGIFSSEVDKAFNKGLNQYEKAVGNILSRAAETLKIQIPNNELKKHEGYER